MIPKTHTVLPFLLAMLVAVAGMPTNVFQVCRKAVGTLEIEPWLERSSSAIAKAVSSASSWMIRLLQLRAPAVCAAAVLLALMVADLSAGHAALVTMAIVPVVGSVQSLQAQRATLMAEVNAFRGADNSFGENLTAATAKMDQIEALDAQIRAAQAEPTPPVPAPPVNAEAIRAQAQQDERNRIKGISEAVRLARLGPEVSADMVGRGITLEAARAEIFAKLAAQSDAQPHTQHVRVGGEDATDKFLRGLTNWLLVKGGMAAEVAKAEKVEARTIDPGEFRGMSLVEIAKECLTRANVSFRGLSKDRIIGAAFTCRGSITQSTSDFATLLENVMHKIVQASYGITPDTWSRFCATGSISDFRAHPRYRHGSFGSLDTVAENGEYKSKSIADGEKESLTAVTKGNLINVSRQMIINDDMGVFTSLLTKLGRAAKLSVEVDVYALLAQNSGDGPTMSDSVALFHASSHGANKTTGAAITAANLDVDRVAMASQRDPNSNEYLDLRPAVLVLPASLGGVARIINTSQYDPDTVANKSQNKPNIVGGLFRDIVDTPRIAATRRYLFADPSIAPVIEVAFLEGQSEPTLESRDGWDVDGTEMKVRLDYAVGAVDWRGAVTNAGV